MQAVEQLVLALPQLVDPLLEFRAVAGVLVVALADELARNLQFLEAHHDVLQASGKQAPEGRAAVRVVDGHVDQGLQLLAHGVEDEGDTAGLGLEQVAERRLLLVVLGAGETGAFEEVEHRYRDAAELGAGLARGRQVLAFLLRVPGQVGLAVALHEGEIEGPPAQADDRDPDQFLLEEEAQQRDASVQLVLQDEDVDPALVVAGDQVGVLVLQALQALDVPAGALDQVHPALVAGDPAFGDQAHDLAAQALGGGERQEQLDQGHAEQQAGPAQGAGHQQQAGQGAAQEMGEKRQHQGVLVRLSLIHI